MDSWGWVGDVAGPRGSDELQQEMAFLGDELVRDVDGMGSESWQRGQAR